jgi:hypothetical protein
VEIHGALVYSPLDDRWRKGGDRLLEGRRPFEWKGLGLEGLRPEALAAHLCGHMWQQHAGEAPKAVVLHDLRAILDREAGTFDWDLFVDLSTSAGFTGAAAEGMSLLRLLPGAPVPAQVLSALGAGERDVVLDLSPAAAGTQRLMDRLRHGGSWRASAVEGARIMFPPRAYLRYRYPDKARWPVLALYPYRWLDQAAKMGRWFRERLRTGRSGG